MKREIKFRVWDKKENQMLSWRKDKRLICEALPQEFGEDWSDRCEVMQYIGMS